MSDNFNTVSMDALPQLPPSSRNFKDKEIAMPPLPPEPTPEPEENLGAIESPSLEVATPQVEDLPVAPEPKPDYIENANSRNIRAIREEREQLKREKEQLARENAELQKRFSAQQPTQQQEPEEDLNFAPDELMEGKHMSKMGREIKKLKEQIAQQNHQNTLENAKMRLRSEYPDMAEVFSKDNLETLEILHPEIAETISSNKNYYSQAVTAYTMIKKLGINKNDTSEADRARVQANAAKPRPLTSLSPQQGESPLSHANAFAQGLTPDLKAQLRKEMFESMKNR